MRNETNFKPQVHVLDITVLKSAEKHTLDLQCDVSALMPYSYIRRPDHLRSLEVQTGLRFTSDGRKDFPAQNAKVAAAERLQWAEANHMLYRFDEVDDFIEASAELLNELRQIVDEEKPVVEAWKTGHKATAKALQKQSDENAESAIKRDRYIGRYIWNCTFEEKVDGDKTFLIAKIFPIFRKETAKR